MSEPGDDKARSRGEAVSVRADATDAPGRSTNDTAPGEEPRPPVASEALLRDLALVLPSGFLTDGGRLHAPVEAFIDGDSIPLNEAIDEAAELIQASVAPAIVGMNLLSMEAARQAVALARLMRGRLLPWPAHDADRFRRPVSFNGTLPWAYAANLVLWVGFGPRLLKMMGPLAQRLAARARQSLMIDNRFDVVQKLRASLRNGQADDHTAYALLQSRRAAVVLPPDTDARLASQWHKLAAEAQQRVRVAVIELPYVEQWANATGVSEVVRWLTGVSCAGGGVDFVESGRLQGEGEAPAEPRGKARLLPSRAGEAGASSNDTDRMSRSSIATGSAGASPSRDAQSLLARGAVDLAIDTGGPSVFDMPGGAPGDVAFRTPGLVPGLKARVMRFDGAVMWLCDDPSSPDAPTDPVVQLLACIAAAVEAKA